MKSMAQKGFTVMEMLVVLVLVGMVTTLLMQGFSYVLHLQVRFQEQLHLQRTGALQSYWFREVCASLTPDYPEGEGVFSGDASHLEGLSLSSLFGGRGAPTPVNIKIVAQDGYVFLFYAERGQEALEIGRWPGEKGVFSYLDKSGQWSTKWPTADGAANQLPNGILLTVETYRQAETWFASLRGRHTPRIRAEDMIKNMFGTSGGS